MQAAIAAVQLLPTVHALPFQPWVVLSKGIERENQSATSGTRKLDAFFIRKQRCTTSDHHNSSLPSAATEGSSSSSPESSPESEITAATDSGLPSTLTEELSSLETTAATHHFLFISRNQKPAILRPIPQCQLRDWALWQQLLSVCQYHQIMVMCFVCCRSSDEFGRRCFLCPPVIKHQCPPLLIHHSKPLHQFAFTAIYLGGCSHALHRNWLDDHPGMAYSTKVDGAFCVPCALFSSGHIKGQLVVTRPFHLAQGSNPVVKLVLETYPFSF